MIELILTILLSTLIIVTVKLIGMLKINELYAITFNYFVATTLGLVIWREPIAMDAFTGKPWFGLSLLVGFAFIISFTLLSRSAARTGLAITAIASRMSVLIPVLMGFIIFHDQLNLQKVIGIFVALLSFYLIFKPTVKIRFDFKFFLLPFLLFLVVGVNDTVMKYVQFHLLNGDETLFLTAAFFIAFIIGLTYLIIAQVRGTIAFNYKSLIAGFILGSLNFAATYFFIRGMEYFDSSVFFPVFNVSVVSLSALVAILFFKERFSKVNLAGIFIAIIALLLITMS